MVLLNHGEAINRGGCCISKHNSRVVGINFNIKQLLALKYLIMQHVACLNNLLDFSIDDFELAPERGPINSEYFGGFALVAFGGFENLFNMLGLKFGQSQ